VTVAGPLAVRPLTDERWPDLEALFGPSGAYSNCWCTWQRISGRAFSAGCANRGAGNRALLRGLAESGAEPGLLAYRDRAAIGWVSTGPRREFGRILRSPITQLTAGEASDPAVWSVACFFIPAAHRGQGVASALLEAAVGRAREASARAIEGYPVDTRGERRQSSSLFTGTLELFLRFGFSRVAERRPGRPVVRRKLS
jgi:GNAT superfamily N-acetyltransferase